MDSFDDLLDEIEADIHLISDEYRAEIEREFKSLRMQFESSITISPTLQARIRNMNIRVRSYIEGVIKTPISSESIEIPELTIYSDELGDGIDLARKKKEEMDLLMMKKQLKKVSKEEDVDKVREFIDLLDSKYEGVKIYSQEVEQAIMAVKYDIMLKYFENGDFNKAEEYSKTFGKDMRIYIVNRLKDKFDELIEEDKFEDVNVLNSYIYGKTIKESDMNLWFSIAKIEGKDIDAEKFEEYKKSKENLPIVQEKKPSLVDMLRVNIAKQKERNERRREIKKQEAAENIKIIIVRYDPESPNGINLRDLKKIQKRHRHKYKVKFEEGITEIPDGLFNLRSNLVGVSLPESLISIGEQAFSKTSITDICLKHTKVTSIPRGCFDGCALLKKIELPNAMTQIGMSAFANSGLIDIDLSNTGITTISSGCFSGCEALESVQLPNCLTQIESNCFMHCCQLKQIEIPSGLEALDSGAFANSGLIDIDLSNTKLKIIKGSYFYENRLVCMGTFESCTSLERIQLPDSLEEIGESAFYKSGIRSIDLRNCRIKKLEGANVHRPEPPSWMTLADDLGYRTMTQQENEYYYGEKNMTMGNGCFACCHNLSLVQLPDTIEVIGSEAFRWSNCTVKIYGRKTLEKLRLGDSCIANLDLTHTDVTEIPMGCFKYCKWPLKVILPTSIKRIGTEAFLKSGVESIDLSRTSVTEIPDECFSNSKLSNIVLPFSLKRIGRDAFRKTNLDRLHLGHTQITECPSGIGLDCEQIKFETPSNEDTQGESKSSKNGVQQDER